LYAWNNPNYGDVYYQDWYRDENETGGLWLQKATHDFDYINHLLDSNPFEICAMSAKRVFKGSMPSNKKCVDCDLMDTCKQGPRQKLIAANEISTMPRKGEFEKYPKYCSFATDTGNEDSCSAIVRYESGVIASYNQCFFARKSAGNRGARIIGYDGTIEFDWNTNILKVYSHHIPKVETIEIISDMTTHGGGDEILSMSFIDIVNEKAQSCSPLIDGVTSCLMCLKAKESCEERIFKAVSF